MKPDNDRDCLTSPIQTFCFSLRIICLILFPKILGIALLAVMIVKINDTNEPKEIFCSNKEVVSNCLCQGITKRIEGVARCYDPNICIDINYLECDSGLHLVQLDNDECPSCKDNPCMDKQIVDGCGCQPDNIVNINDDLSYCNTGTDLCNTSVNKSYCERNNKELDFDLIVGRNILRKCPECIMKTCENFYPIINCNCTHKKLIDNNGHEFCINTEICSNIGIDDDGNCPAGTYLNFQYSENHRLNACPLCKKADQCNRRANITNNPPCLDKCSESQITKIENDINICPDDVSFENDCLSSCPNNDTKNSSNLRVILPSIIVPIVIIIVGIVVVVTVKRKNKNQNNANNGLIEDLKTVRNYDL